MNLSDVRNNKHINYEIITRKILIFFYRVSKLKLRRNYSWKQSLTMPDMSKVQKENVLPL